MIWASYVLRVAIVIACIYVLNAIVPISIMQLRAGDACPFLGPVPACHVVSLSYASMILGVTVFWRSVRPLFFIGLLPVLLLASIGTASELSGQPTCPRSQSGWPLCYSSFVMGLGLFISALAVIRLERLGRQ